MFCNVVIFCFSKRLRLLRVKKLNYRMYTDVICFASPPPPPTPAPLPWCASAHLPTHPPTFQSRPRAHFIAIPFRWLALMTGAREICRLFTIIDRSGERGQQHVRLEGSIFSRFSRILGFSVGVLRSHDDFGRVVLLGNTVLRTECGV